MLGYILAQQIKLSTDEKDKEVKENKYNQNLSLFWYYTKFIMFFIIEKINNHRKNIKRPLTKLALNYNKMQAKNLDDIRNDPKTITQHKKMTYLKLLIFEHLDPIRKQIISPLSHP